MRDLSDLYFECHVTLEPVSGAELQILEKLSGRYGFQVAAFLLQKDGTTPDSFTSARDKSFSSILSRMAKLIHALNEAKFTIKRYKIEDTIIDSKRQGDFLKLVDPEYIVTSSNHIVVGG